MMADSLSYWQLSFLTFQAVVQVIVICAFGFIAARGGLLNGPAQKYISRLNVDLFTPCLIFSKLASSLSLSALIDIFVVPLLFLITTLVSLGSARVVSRLLKLNRPESNFVTAMAVFGNSNSLPVSLTLQLAYTLPNLLWPDLPGDNQDDVASRGILYLLVFQQLGQVLRWSWGYNTLLAPHNLLPTGVNTPAIQYSDEEEEDSFVPHHHEERTANNGDGLSEQSSLLSPTSQSTPFVFEKKTIARYFNTYVYLPCKRGWKWFRGVMNPPLWSMLIAIFIASVPALRYEFFECGGFVQNTFTAAIQQLGKVAIPLILVILGSNLNPDPSVPPASPRYKRIVFASLLSRMILPAIILLPIIALSVKYIGVSILDDPIFLIVAFILTIAPPAIQLSQICQLNNVFEKEMAGVLFWGYVVLTLPSTIFIVVASLKVMDWAGVSES